MYAVLVGLTNVDLPTTSFSVLSVAAVAPRQQWSAEWLECAPAVESALPATGVVYHPRTPHESPCPPWQLRPFQMLSLSHGSSVPHPMLTAPLWPTVHSLHLVLIPPFLP